ncbi:MAG TPA: MspA family porin, partial [Mycobacterium sp.]
MTVGDVLRRGITVLAVGGLLGCQSVATAAAQPEPEPVPVDAPVAFPPGPDGLPPLPPVDEGHVESTPPAVTDTPDGWQITLSATDETQAPIPPLTTALSSREYVVGGTYSGTLRGPDEG